MLPAAVAPQPRQGVAPVTACALAPLREAHTDGAHEPVLVKVEHHARPGLARGGQRTPPERRLQVVSVHDAHLKAADEIGDFLWIQPAA